jgi:hypothetical protein
MYDFTRVPEGTTSLNRHKPATNIKELERDRNMCTPVVIQSELGLSRKRGKHVKQNQYMNQVSEIILFSKLSFLVISITYCAFFIA